MVLSTGFFEIFLVGRLGLEPRTNALKGHCSTIELPSQYTAFLVEGKVLFEGGFTWLAFRLGLILQVAIALIPCLSRILQNEKESR